MSTCSRVVYTIGHSNHTWDKFLGMILPHRIELLVDVRSYPRSRFAPWSNRGRLELHLARYGIDYVWKGDTLGGMPRGPKTPKTTDDMTVDNWYRNRRIAPDFLSGIADISHVAEGKRLAMMCSEGDPTRCHRSLLLEPALQMHDVLIRHIDPKNGQILISFDLSVSGGQE